MSLHCGGKQATCRPSSFFVLPHGGVGQLTAERKRIERFTEGANKQTLLVKKKKIINPDSSAPADLLPA